MRLAYETGVVTTLPALNGELPWSRTRCAQERRGYSPLQSPMLLAIQIKLKDNGAAHTI